MINRDIYTRTGGNSDEEEIKFLKMAINDYKKSDCINQRIIKNEKQMDKFKKLTNFYYIIFIRIFKSIVSIS